MPTWVAIGAGLLAFILSSAQAEISPAQVERVVAAKNLTISGRRPDTIIVTAPTGDQIALGFLDARGDGTRTVLAMLAVYENSNGLQAAAFNRWNARATYKGFMMQSKAAVLQVNVMVGDIPDVTIAAAFDLFVEETVNFRGFLYGQNLMNSASLPDPRADLRPASVIDPLIDPKQHFDGGLSRKEIGARDNAFTASLNRAPAARKAAASRLPLTEAQMLLFADGDEVAVNRP